MFLWSITFLIFQQILFLLFYEIQGYFLLHVSEGSFTVGISNVYKCWNKSEN